ncbi:elongation factor 1-delta isoform X2 [Homalodisca vitripennis]|uniref:elongation factor 1-delta isoform X2 n=1 Tax=Homalodisca vitripennis TaxID=197043 RepID=UPI001EEB61F9|nr:elongation factor 1-delta isoform X2 [Homalodisca vitripennis]
MEVALAQEKIWFDKYKYEEAEKAYFENLSKLQKLDGFSNQTPEPPKTNISRSPAPKPAKDDTVKPVPNPDPTPNPAPNPISNPVTYITITEPRMDDKRFKVKNRNKTKKDDETKVEKTVKTEMKMDDLAKLTSENIAVEFNNRLNTLETENASLKKDVNELTEMMKKLNERISTLEKSGSASSAKPAAPAPAAAAPQKPASKPKVEDDDDGVDLFGSDSEEEDEDAKKVKEQRLAEYAARKSKKPVLIAKSNIILDVKPWDDETDMKKMEVEVRKVTTDGLIWGASKLVPLAYGIHKLQISCVVEDDKVSVDWLQEQLEAIEDFVQSVDIAAFNKV